MGRISWKIKKRNRNKGEYPGRPSYCDNEPGRRLCLKQLYGPKPALCRECRAAEAQAEKVKVFGR